MTFADPGQVYGSHESEGKFFGSAKLFDAEGKELASYASPLLSSDGSYVGWTTRAANMSVDNVTVKVEAAYRTLLAIGKLPSKVTEKNIEDVKELAATARELYDALPEDKKALVINLGKLTKAEDAISALENATEAPTEAPTEPPTEAPTEPDETPTDPVEIPTDSSTDADTDGVTEAPTDPEEDTEDATDGEAEPEVRIMDDSLFIWILIAVMIVAVLGAAAYITVETRK